MFHAIPNVVTDETINGTDEARTVVLTEHDVRDYGATGNGETNDTDAIQAAIDACRDVGGRVVLPAGTYLSDPLFLEDRMEFHLEPGALLQATDEIDRYPSIESRMAGIEATTYASLLTGRDLEAVAITGNGHLDGAGPAWWEAVRDDRELLRDYEFEKREHYVPDNRPPEATLNFARPRTIDLKDCSDVIVRDINITNSPSWTIHPIYCENVVIENVSIRQPYESPNTDGINPDSCRNVRISNCHIDCGDDCIVLKSGFDADGRRVGRPTENVTITGCTTGRGRAAVAVGSETAGGIHNVTVTNCVFDGTKRGLRIKSKRGRGGTVEGIRATNIAMRDIETAISVTTGYRKDPETEPVPVSEETPTLRDISLRGIAARDVDNAGRIDGLPEQPLREFGLENVRIRAAGGMEIQNAERVVLDDVRVDAGNGPAIRLNAVTDCDAFRLRGEGSSTIELDDVADTIVEPRVPAGIDDDYLTAVGETRGIDLRDPSAGAD